MKKYLSMLLSGGTLMGQLLAANIVCAQASDSWRVVQEENAGTVGANYVPRLREQGFTPEQARQTLACLTAAQSQGIPGLALTSRLDEGLAKNAEPQTILAAVQKRQSVLTQADTLLKAAHYDAMSESPHEELLIATGLALESGLPAEDLATVLQRGNGQNALRIKSIVEAGESLCLSGVECATTQALMNDCMDRNLRRMEVLRAVRYSIQQHRGGMSGENIRHSLWGGNVAIEGAHGWRGGGSGGGGNGFGSGAGSGGGPSVGMGGGSSSSGMGGTSANGGSPANSGGTSGNGPMGGGNSNSGNGNTGAGGPQRMDGRQ